MVDENQKHDHDLDSEFIKEVCLVFYTFVSCILDVIITYLLIVFWFVQVLDGDENTYDYYGDSDLENVEVSTDSNTLNNSEVCLLHLLFMSINGWHNFMFSRYNIFSLTSC